MHEVKTGSKYIVNWKLLSVPLSDCLNLCVCEALISEPWSTYLKRF